MSLAVLEVSETASSPHDDDVNVPVVPLSVPTEESVVLALVTLEEVSWVVGRGFPLHDAVLAATTLPPDPVPVV